MIYGIVMVPEALGKNINPPGSFLNSRGEGEFVFADKE
jgi:hypothetical protein